MIKGLGSVSDYPLAWDMARMWGGLWGVLSSSWVNLHWYGEIGADLFRINPLGENIEGSIQTMVRKQNEHLFHRHNYNCQGRKFFQNYLISEMGNKLVSLLGISTLVQWFIANLSMTKPHQIHQVSPFSHNKSHLGLRGWGKLCVRNIRSLCHQCKTWGCAGERSLEKWGYSSCKCLRCYF